MAIREAFIGAQWGDEGKAKIIDERVRAAQEQDNKRRIVVRFQGGPNAGHTMCFETRDGKEVKFVTHAAPSGLTSDSDIAIGPNVAYDPEKFLNEVRSAVEQFGYSAGIHISERVGILFDYHRKMDGWQESKRDESSRIGTTKSGIGPFYMDNANRATRITFADYIGDRFHDRLREVLKAKGHELPPETLTSDYLEQLIATHDPIRAQLRFASCRLEYRLQEALRNNEHIFLEGAQGTMLDVDFGTNPDTTSSHLTAPAGLASLGLPRSAFKIYLVEKVYPTRVGSGHMPTLDLGNFGKIVALNSGEFGATTGRKRRVGYPDLVIVRYSAMINDADGIYLTRADCVQDWPMNVCVAYQFDGQTIMEVPLKLEKAKPVYGDKTYSWRLWDGSRDLSDPLRNDRAAIEARESYLAGGFKSLPLGIREFVKDHNEYVGKSILGISIGPRRGQTIKAPVSF